MTSWHNEELSKYDEIDGNVDKLGSTITRGFSDCSTANSDVQTSVSNELSGLKNQVVTSAEETRRVVKGGLDRATQRTLGALDKLSGSIDTVHQQTMNQISGMNDVIVQRNAQLRGVICEEFYQRQLQAREMVVSATNLVAATARTTTNLLLDQIDAVEVVLMQQLRAIAGNIDVMQDQIVLLETQFDNAQKQVDKMLAFLASIQYTSNEILSTVVSYPDALRKALFANNIDKLLLSYKKINYAFTKYVENGLAPVYRNDLVTACASYANTDDLLRSFTNLITVTTTPERLEQQVAQFEYKTRDYEQFGGQLIAAAYNTQRLPFVCARLQSNLDTDTFLRLANSWDIVVDSVVGIHLINIEENVPRFFLNKYYKEPILTTYLNEERALWSSDASHPFALDALEQLHYCLQEQVGGLAALSVVNVPSTSQLQLWSLEFGPRWQDGGHQSEIPTALRDRLQQTNLPASGLSVDTLGAAFSGTAWQPHLDAGLVRAVVRVGKVDDVCPWAVSSTHYPFCWERAAGCNCMQLEGLPGTPTAAQMTNRSLVPTDVALFTTFESLTDARSEFLTTAKRQTRASASDASRSVNEMCGVPANRVRFSLCMASELVHAVRTASGDVHQPPPQFKRCVANDKKAYNVMYDAMLSATASSGSSSFLASGNVVSEAMFRSLEIGGTVPEVTFFDAQDGHGNYIVCSNCVMDELRMVYMFRVLSFKLGRPVREKSAVCERHPRLANIEYCPQAANADASSSSSARFWTPPILLATELTRLVASVGASFESGLTDRVAMAERMSDGLQQFLGVATDDFAFFKVYVAPAGAFNATDAFWTIMPTHEDREERGWTVVPSFYVATSAADASGVPVVRAYDALVMWSTLPARPRRVAYHVISKKPVGVSLKIYLESTFAAYKTERILRGFFSERVSPEATECPVAGDTDRFTYCTPVPVDGQYMCVQLEDLTDEYRDHFDGSASNGHVVFFVATAAATTSGSAANATATAPDAASEPAAYLVGRSKGAFVHDGLSVQVDGRPWRNMNDVSLCLQTDFSHPERGSTCVMALQSSGSMLQQRGLRVQLDKDATRPSVIVGERVAEVFVSSATWNARCCGCTDAVVSEMVQFQEGGGEQEVQVLFSGLVAGSECATVDADGGGELMVCIVG